MKNTLDIEKMNTTIDKVKIYKNQIDINLNNINENFENTNYYYNTLNSEKIVTLQEQLKNKFNVIRQIHENDINYLIKKVNTYNETSMKVSQMFKDIN